MKFLTAALAVLACTMVAGCGAMVLTGSGNVETEERDVGGFDSVSLSSIGELTIRQTGEEGLTVTADDNVLEHIVTEVRGTTLWIGLSKECRGRIVKVQSPIRYELTVKDLSGISVSGSGTARMESLTSGILSVAVSGSGSVRVPGLTAETVAVAISGSGDVVVGGTTSTQTVAISGSGEYEARELGSAAASITVSGSGDATVSVAETLEAYVSGSGSVGYYGDPEVDRRVSGSGEVRKLGAGTASL
ncbi:MAG: head GIN domain-containing protein [Candidatus Eisenbacteria bacterium]